MSEIKTKQIDFLLGCDPEFTFFDVRNQRVVGAGTHLRDSLGGLGVDGNGTTVEVRPSPSANPIKVVMNLRNIFVEYSMKYPKILDLEWAGGSYKHGYPQGGHIHFGYDKSTVKIDQNFAVEVLSQYLGAITLLIEDEKEGKSRRSNYGGRTDLRSQDHGLEYRTPSSWITSPYVASGILCLAKTIFWELLNNPELQKNFKQLFSNEDFKNMNTSKILTHFPNLWKDITQMQKYNMYKPYIDFIYFLIKEERKWFSAPSQDLKDSWGIIDLSTVYRENSNINLNILWERYKLSVMGA